MSDFLAKVINNKALLGAWIRTSVGEMDRILDDGFPNIFGKNWRQKMSSFPTAARTKLLTYVFDHALEEMSSRMKIDYRPAQNAGASETNNFDCYLFEYEVENKLSLGSQPSSFATGSSHNTDNKVKRILAVKVISNDYKSDKIFAGAIDLEDAQHENTQWHAGDASKSGFSTLRISISDRDVIVPLCGDINAIDSGNRKYVNVRYEKVGRKRGDNDECQN